MVSNDANVVFFFCNKKFLASFYVIFNVFFVIFHG